MTKQKSIPAYVTREILKEEISASEQRLDAKIVGLDAKIDTTAQSLKQYTDSRYDRLDAKIEGLGTKMDRYFEGIVKMVEGFIGKVTGGEDRLKDHEVRIRALERKGPQPGRI
jgi:hypothetical protein